MTTLKLNSTHKYPSYYYFDKKSFLNLVDDIKSEGFTEIEIKVPNNLPESKSKIDLNKFINFNYNFLAIILICKNVENGDLVKILFVNNVAASKRFDDFTFPSSESEGPKYHISTDDQVRLVGLTVFIKKILIKHNLNKGIEFFITRFLSYGSFLFLFFATPFIYGHITNPSAPYLSLEVKILLVVFYIVSIIIPFIYSIYIKRGVYIKKFESPTLSFVTRILNGDFRDNPIIMVFWKLAVFAFSGIVGWALLEFLRNFLSG